MKVNIDIRDLKPERYMILILSAQIFCKTVKYTDNYIKAVEIANKYEQVGCICIISHILNNSLNKPDKWAYNE